MSTKPADSAVEYARLGYPVFPCMPGAKLPACEHGLLDATRDVDAIRRWWRATPNANIGIACTGLVAVDLDPARPAEWPGPEKAAMIKALQPPIQRTPRGGLHIIFRRPAGVQWRNSTGRLARGIDVRTDGGYIVAAPSRTENGQYQWVRALVPPGELPEPPAWLQCELDRIAHQPTSVATAVQAVLDEATCWPEGVRNVQLFKLACRLRRAGLSASEIESALQIANGQRCRPPLPPAEVAVIVRSAGRYPPGPGELPFAMRKAWRHAIEHRRRVLQRKGQP